MTRAAVLAVGLATPLGDDPAAVLEALRSGRVGLRAHPPLAHLPGGALAGVVDGPDLKPWLRRRKDQKIMARASELALAAAGRALAGGGPAAQAALEDLGIFLGVGREPPDDGESEAALAVSAVGGRLDDALLAGPGRDRYPPLLPLRTLPNMALAHISINIGAMGENGAWAGGAGAGLRAVVAGVRAVAEGRCPFALAGGADSLVDLGSARDRLRGGGRGPPGEGAAVLLLGPAGAAGALAELEVGAAAEDWALDAAVAQQMGDLGAACGAVALALAAAGARGSGGGGVSRADPGEPAAHLQVRPPGAC